MNPFVLWIVWRILTSIIAGMVSSIKPITSIEIRIPLLPPSSPLVQWFDRAFLSPWERWDAVWYQQIVTHGYSASDGTAQFHPLYPWLATPLAWLGISPTLSLLIITSLAGIALYYFFRKFASYDLTTKDATFAIMLFALAPPAFILFAPYSEALFLLAAVLCLVFLRKKSWWLAGLMAGLATLTRQQGILLAVPIAWELWENADREFPKFIQQWRNWFSLILVPVGLLIWLLYRAFLLNDIHTRMTNLQDFLYSFAISPSATKVVPEQQFVWPWQAIYLGFQKLLTKPDIDIWVNIIIALAFLVILAVSWVKMRMSYRLYSLAITLISFSYFTGSVHPYMGLPRHLFLAFPVFIGMAAVVKKQWHRLLLIGLSSVAMLFLLVLYVLKTWVP